MELQYVFRDEHHLIWWSRKKAVRIEIPIYYMAVARKDWELPNSRRRGRESVLTPVPQRLIPLIIFPGERDID